MKLEDHLYINKHLLDVEEPEEYMEENILSKLPRRKKVIGTYWKVAALFIIITGFGALVFQSTEENGKKTEQAFMRTKPKVDPANHNQVVNTCHPSLSKGSTVSLIYKKENGRIIRKGESGTIEKEAGQGEDVLSELVLFHKKMNVYSDSLSSLITRIRAIPIFNEEPEYYKSFIVAFDRIKDSEQSLQQDIRRAGITKSTTAMLLKANEEKLELLSELQMEVQKANRLIEMNGAGSQNNVSYLNIRK